MQGDDDKYRKEIRQRIAKLLRRIFAENLLGIGFTQQNGKFSKNTQNGDFRRAFRDSQQSMAVFYHSLINFPILLVIA